MSRLRFWTSCTERPEGGGLVVDLDIATMFRLAVEREEGSATAVESALPDYHSDSSSDSESRRSVNYWGPEPREVDDLPQELFLSSPPGLN